jgi:hypothetical protein
VKYQKISVLNVNVFKMHEAIASASPLTCSEHYAYLKLCIHHLVEVEQCCPTFLCTRAQFTDAYGGAGTTTLLLLLLLLPPPPPPPPLQKTIIIIK